MNIQSLPTEITSDWQETNLAAIQARLAPIVAQTELAEIIQSKFQGVFLRRIENNLELYCYNQKSNTLSEIMSRIDLTNPLRLIAQYSHAVMLSAKWQDRDPERIYIAGMGGGRLSMLFHHLFPEIQIDGSDIDPAMISICEDYFGLHLDDRHDIRAADSRADLVQRTGDYDIVILDVFFGEGDHPNHLATVEFLQECKAKMTPNGVFVANLVHTDPWYLAKIAAIVEVFPNCLDWDHEGAHVVFGSNHNPDYTTLSSRIKELMTAADPDFPTDKQISRLIPITPNRVKEPALRDS